MCEVKIDCCPYCKSKNFEHMGENDYWNGMPWHCHECDNWFSEDDYLHQLYWENISCLLNETSEEEPLVLDSYIILPSVEEESCGLSDSEKLNIDKMFQVEGEGTMWYHFEGEDDMNTGEPTWRDMYELSTKDLEFLLKELRENCKKK